MIDASFSDLFTRFFEQVKPFLPVHLTGGHSIVDKWLSGRSFLTALMFRQSVRAGMLKAKVSRLETHKIIIFSTLNQKHVQKAP